MKPNLLLISSLSALLACSDARHSDQSTTSGSGVSASGTFTIDPAPVVTIPADSSDDRALIGHVVGGTQLLDGTIVIADGYEPSLKSYSKSGQFLHSSGRRGGGPGEFQSIRWLGLCGPSNVFAWDPGQSRMSVFDHGRKFSREVHLPGQPVFFACALSGMFATMMDPNGSPEPSEHAPRLFSRLMLVNQNGDSLWSLPDIYIGQNRPMATITRIALSTDRLYVGTGDSAYVDEYDLKGQLVRVFKVGDGPRASTRLHYERAIDRLLAQLPGTPEARQLIKDRMLAIPMPDHLPPYTDLLVDPTGSLWVVTSVAGDDTTKISAFTPAGEKLGEIRLPLEMKVLEVGRDYILGESESSDGQEVVTMYRYRRN